MLSERLLDHFDDVARPLNLDEVRERPPAELPVDFGLAEHSDDAIVFEFEASEPEHRSRRLLATAAAVVIAFVVGGIALVSLTPPEQEVNSADDSDEVNELPTLPGDLSNVRWREIQPPFTGLQEGTTADVRDVVVADGVAWAVGLEGLLTGELTQLVNPDLGFSGRAAVWRSIDGERWEPIDLRLPPLEAPVAQVTDVATLDFVVATSDGAIWAFGSDFLFDEENEDFGGNAVGYRSIDGADWQPLRLPPVDGVASAVDSVSTDGLSVLVEINDFDVAGTGTLDETRTFVTTDGETWTQVGEPRSPQVVQKSVLVDGDIVAVTPADLSGETTLPLEVIQGPEFLVAAGEEVDALPVDEASIQRAKLWTSKDGQTWQALGIPLLDNTEATDLLAAHDAGVLAVVTRQTQEQRESVLLNVYGRGTVFVVAVLPSTNLDDLFELNGGFFLIGHPERADDFAEPTPDSVWVAEFPAEPGSPDGG